MGMIQRARERTEGKQKEEKMDEALRIQEQVETDEQRLEKMASLEARAKGERDWRARKALLQRVKDIQNAMLADCLW